MACHLTAARRRDLAEGLPIRVASDELGGGRRSAVRKRFPVSRALMLMLATGALLSCGEGSSQNLTSTERSVGGGGATVGDTTPPTAPASISAIADGPFGTRIIWQAAVDDVAVVGYRIERCQGVNCSNFTQITSIRGDTVYTDTGLASDTSYSYRVRAVDAAANFGAYSLIASTTTGAAPEVPSLASLPAWVSALAPGAWYEIPNTAMSSIEPVPLPPGATGGASKVIAWTSFAADRRNSMVYSVANGGHENYSGNEVDRLELESDPPRWVNRLAPTPAAQLIPNATHYADGRPVSRHSYYGMVFIEPADQIVIFSGAIYNSGNMFRTTDSYNITGNTYSPAGTHPNVPDQIANPNTGNYAPATTVDPANGNIYTFSNQLAARWTRSSNQWEMLATTGASKPLGNESASAFDSARGRVFILGGGGGARHTFDVATNAYSQVALAGPEASAVSDHKMGMVYVPAIDRFLLRRSGPGATVYQIHPSTFEVTLLATTGGGAVPLTENGPYNKFLYVPRLRGIVYVPSYRGNAWFLRVF